MENFIRIYKNAYSSEYCEQTIDWFEKVTECGFGRPRSEPRHVKDDISVFMNDNDTQSLFATSKLSKEFIEIFWAKGYEDYSSKFSLLNTFDEHTIYDLKVQKTKPGGGYHIWHAEDGSRKVSDRILVFTLYLNDVSEGGETEFLYYGLRVKPEQGTLIIWPAGFTHAHRGNPPLQETKYIVTGWVVFK